MLKVVNDEDLEVVTFYWDGKKVLMIIEGLIVFKHQVLDYQFMIWLPTAGQNHVPRA